MIKITPDAGLATPEAIQIRIEQVRAAGGNTPAAALRIAALKARLPKSQFAAMLPAISPELLVSKSELEWGDRKRMVMA